MTADRITYDADTGDQHLDEVFITDATIHVERMGHHDWWFAIYQGDQRIDFNCSDLWVQERDGFDAAMRVDPPLLGCAVEWGDFPHGHRCEKLSRHRKHQCECGATP
jgi:hypothetical protein